MILRRVLLIALGSVLVAASGLGGPPARADDGLPAVQEFEPPGGKGRLVVVLSGQTGPRNYTHVAKDLAEKGYYAVLVDGNDMFGKSIPGEERLRGVIERAAQSPHAEPGKAAVVGFSLGGGATITYATRMPDLVGAAVASYPMTRHISNAKGFVARVQVPLLLMAGTQDTYHDCCLIETARQIAEEAKAAGKDAGSFQLVEYPAGHGWNLQIPREFRADVSADSFQRTLDFLQAHR